MNSRNNPSLLKILVATIADAIVLRSTNHRAERKAAKITAWATGWLALLTGLLIGVGILQWQTLDAQYNETVSEQRPVLWLENMPLSAPNIPTWVEVGGDSGEKLGQIVWEIPIKNFGRGFVKSGRVIRYAKLRNEPEERIPPGQEFTPLEPVGPGQSFLVSIVFHTSMTKDRFDILLKTWAGFTARVDVSYFDLAGVEYRSSMCVTTSQDKIAELPVRGNACSYRAFVN